MPPPARAFPEEIVEEILLRLPPDEPAWIVRASLASKPWHGLLSSARFRGRYIEFHGAPPMLGFLISRPWNCLRPNEGDPVPPFVSTTGFQARIPDDVSTTGARDYAVWDCRHGRVLLREYNAAPIIKLAVWDPMTGRRRELREPRCLVVEHRDGLHGAAVLCDVPGCDHRACNEGPFRVVFFSLHKGGDHGDLVAQVCTSSTTNTGDSHCGEWSEPCSGVPIASYGFIEPSPPVLVKDALHFMLGYDGEGDVHVQILEYNLSSHCLSLIDAPSAGANMLDVAILMAMEDGSLGFAHWKGSALYLWSRQIGSDDGVVATWTRWRVIDLKKIPPIKNPKKFISLLGSVEGRDIIFVYTKLGIYQINLKTLQRKKIWKAECFNALIPYMSFYRPRERVRDSDVHASLTTYG